MKKLKRTMAILLAFFAMATFSCCDILSKITGKVNNVETARGTAVSDSKQWNEAFYNAFVASCYEGYVMTQKYLSEDESTSDSRSVTYYFTGINGDAIAIDEDGDFYYIVNDGGYCTYVSESGKEAEKTDEPFGSVLCDSWFTGLAPIFDCYENVGFSMWEYDNSKGVYTVEVGGTVAEVKIIDGTVRSCSFTQVDGGETYSQKVDIGKPNISVPFYTIEE